MKKMEQKDMCLTYKTLRTFSLLAFAAVITVVGLFSITNVTEAANPIAGTLNPTGANVTWDGTQFGGVAANGEADCATIPTVCDEFALTLGGTVADWTNKRARVQINWTLPATDYDMYIYKGTTLTGSVVASSANGTTTFEQADHKSVFNRSRTLHGARRLFCGNDCRSIQRNCQRGQRVLRRLCRRQAPAS